MKPVQYFSDEYIVQCRLIDAEAILEFLENFRLIQAPPAKSILISMKVPDALLKGFRRKSEILGVPYQTQIKNLMRAWLDGE